MSKRGTELVVIGGAYDGRRVTVDLQLVGRRLRLPISDPRFDSMVAFAANVPSHYEPDVEEYELAEFADTTGTTGAWVHPSVDRPLAELLAGYHGPALEFAETPTELRQLLHAAKADAEQLRHKVAGHVQAFNDGLPGREWFDKHLPAKYLGQNVLNAAAEYCAELLEQLAERGN